MSIDEVQAEEFADSDAQVSSSPLSKIQTVFLWLTVWPTALVLMLLAVGASKELGLEGATHLIVGFVAITAITAVARWSWKVLRRGRFRAGVVVGALGWIYGPLYGVAALVMLAAGANCNDVDVDRLLDGPDETAQLTSESFASAGEAESQAQRLAELMRVQRAGRFEDCVDELYEIHDARSRIDETIRAMRRVSVTSAQAVVYDTIVDVCLHHAEKPSDDLGPYFGKSLQNAKADRFKEAKKHDACSLEEYRPDPWNHLGSSLLDIRRGMCRLDRDEAHVLELKAKGYTNREIGERLDISESLVGNRVFSARENLSILLERNKNRLRP